MKVKFLTWLGALLWLLMASSSAWAATYTCTMSLVSAATPTYSPFATSITTSNTVSTVNVNCARDFNGGTSLVYKITNDQTSGSPPRRLAKNTTNASITLPYDVYTTASSGTCSGTAWGPTNNVTGTLTYSSSTSTSTNGPVSSAFNICIATGATNVTPGTYSDIVTLNLSNNVTGGTTVNAAPLQITINITVTKECTTDVSAATTIVDFGIYTSFGGAKSGSASFKAKCTTSTAYTMALTDNVGAALTNGVVAGLNYSLALSASGGTGIGANQTYTINGTMPAGQAGSCASSACSGLPTTNTSHYLTVTY